MTTASSLTPVPLETVHHSDGAHQHVVVTARGEFDLSNSSALEEELLAPLWAQPSWLELDASQVEFADSSVLAVLVEVHRRAQLVGCSFRLAKPSPVLLKLLRVTGLDRVLTVCG